MDIEVEVDLDDKLVANLIALTGISDINLLVRRALEELIDAEQQRKRQGFPGA